MDNSMLHLIRNECLALLLSGESADTAGLASFLPALRGQVRDVPALGHICDKIDRVLAGDRTGILELSRLVSGMLLLEAEFCDEDAELSELEHAPYFGGLEQTSYREYSRLRLALSGPGAETDRLLERYIASPASFDLRLMPELCELGHSARLSTRRLAGRLLALLTLETPDEPAAEDGGAMAARVLGQIDDCLAAEDFDAAEELLRGLEDRQGLPAELIAPVCRLLDRAVAAGRRSLERAAVCALAQSGAGEALAALEERLPVLDSARAVFSMALESYSAGAFYRRYREELPEAPERHYRDFRDAMVCHLLIGNGADCRWSDYFAQREDRLPALMTAGRGNACAVAYLRSFKSGGEPPSASDLLLNLALVPQALLRMEIYDFWESLWDYLEDAMNACLRAGRELPSCLFDEHIVFTLSLNGEWMIEKLHDYADAHAGGRQARELLCLLGERMSLEASR